VCFNSGGGHLARECPEAGRGFGKNGGDSKSGSKGCCICGADHLARERPAAVYGCGFSSKKGGSQGCSNCGGDHLDRECPEDSGEKGGGQRGDSKGGGSKLQTAAATTWRPLGEKVCRDLWDRGSCRLPFWRRVQVLARHLSARRATALDFIGC